MRNISPIDICNMALGNISDRTITRLDDAAAEEDALVRYCQEFYEQARAEVLEAHRWGFAKKTAALSRRSSSPAIGFRYSQVLPPDMLRLLSLHPGTLVGDETAPTSYSSRKLDRFEIVGIDVFTDEQFVAAKYIYDSTNPNDWTAHVRTAVARRLSSLLAGPLTDGPQEVRAQLDVYARIDLPNAQYYDAVQDKSGENSDLETIRAGSPLLGARRDDIGGEFDENYSRY